MQGFNSCMVNELDDSRMGSGKGRGLDPREHKTRPYEIRKARTLPRKPTSMEATGDNSSHVSLGDAGPCDRGNGETNNF